MCNGVSCSPCSPGPCPYYLVTAGTGQALWTFTWFLGTVNTVANCSQTYVIDYLAFSEGQNFPLSPGDVNFWYTAPNDIYSFDRIRDNCLTYSPTGGVATLSPSCTLPMQNVTFTPQPNFAQGYG